MEIFKKKLKTFQAKFVDSPARYPAFVAGVGTGKTMSAILRGMILSQKYPNNLGLIVRKEYTDLRDSTLKDFVQYTGLEIDSNKEARLSNGSVIMFRHGSETAVLKNVNLGWFFIEQAEEFETEEQFIFLRDRLRRENVGVRTGFITANTNGHNWIWRLWKAGFNPGYQLIEATTFDADYLPPDYLADRRRLEKESPHHYNRFVNNSWEEADIDDTLIPDNIVRKAVGRDLDFLSPQEKKVVVVCDVADFGGDEIPIYTIENGKIIEQEFYREKSTMETAGHIISMKRRNNADMICVDSLGDGRGVCDRLRELGEYVYEFIASESPENKEIYKNKRAEAWFHARDLFTEGKVSIPDDEQLITQLSSVKFKYLSTGQIILEPKDQTKKRLGRSPDRADALVMGLYALKFVPKKKKDKMAWIDKYKEPTYQKQTTHMSV